MQRFFSILFFAAFSLISAAQSGVPRLSTEQISAMQNVTDGTTVFNTTTGCLNYFFGGMWNESCGNCIPKYSKPRITKINALKQGVEIELADTGFYQAILLPDSEIISTRSQKMIIATPPMASANKKYRVLVSNLNDPCIRRPATDTAIVFPVEMVNGKPVKAKYPFATVSTAQNIWMAEPLANMVSDEKVCMKVNGRPYYNWNALNKDSFNLTAPVYYSKNVCPAGFAIPTVKQAEDLIAYNNQQPLLTEFKLAQEGFVMNPADKTEVTTDERNLFMLKNTEHPEGFNVLLLTPTDIRVAQLPRGAWVRVLCVKITDNTN